MKKKTKLRICTIGAIGLTIVLVALYFILTDAAYAVAGTEYKHVVDGAMPVINSIYIITMCIGGFTTSFLVYLNLTKLDKENPGDLV